MNESDLEFNGYMQKLNGILSKRLTDNERKTLREICPEAEDEYWRRMAKLKTAPKTIYGLEKWKWDAIITAAQNILAIARAFLDLWAENERLTEERNQILAGLYSAGFEKEVGRICDEQLDRSGQLLALIREKAKEAP